MLKNIDGSDPFVRAVVFAIAAVIGFGLMIFFTYR